MPQLNDVYQKLNASITSNIVLYKYCLSPSGMHTQVGVEAAFLQVQKSWELFCEEILLNILSGKQPVSNTVTTFFTVADEEIARKVVYQTKPYLDWNNRDKIVEKFNVYIQAPNHIISAINAISSELKEINIVRNYIAHSSKKAREDFEGLCRQKLGGNPSITSAADFLLLVADHQNPPDANFEKYLQVLDITANNIVS